MNETPHAALASEPTPTELRDRILAGILYAAARFVPVPLLDDLLREQIQRWMVRRILPATLSRDGTRPLYADQSGCLGGALRAIAWIPIKLLLFPVRKVLSVVLGVRWVSRDIAEMLLGTDARVQIASVQASIDALRVFWLAEAALDMALIGKPALAALPAAPAAAPSPGGDAH